MKEVDKGWGKEIIFADNDGYAGKLLQFDRKGARMSLHFHKVKDETWYVLSGEFILTTHNLSNCISDSMPFVRGDCFHVPPMLPHRLECTSERGVIVEVSTPDDPCDNYRIAPGDSQKSQE